MEEIMVILCEWWKGGGVNGGVIIVVSYSWRRGQNDQHITRLTPNEIHSAYSPCHAEHDQGLSLQFKSNLGIS